MTRVSITTLGCRVNSYESDAMAGLLRERGFEVVSEHEAADICIVNTCTVTNIADRKSRQMISRCLKLNKDARIIVTGCWSQRFPDAASGLDGVTAVMGSSEKSRIADICTEVLSGARINTVRDISHEHVFEDVSAVAEGRTRAYLKIQDGCDHYCSYCAIPFARGGVRSRSPESVRRELERLNEAGFVEVVFTGIHLTDYGRDLGGVDLADALTCASGLENIKRIRFGSLEPHGMSERLISRITSDERVCPQFHLSLQSGSTTVLERMRRGYSADEYADIVDMIRSSYGEKAHRVAITTDLIAGFVGETPDEHRETMEFVRRIGFSRLHVFPYSRRSGTLADRMPGQLMNSEKTARARELISLGRELERDFLERFLGGMESVLIESERSDGLSYGYTDNYIKVLTKHEQSNTLVETKLRSIMEDEKGELFILSDSIGRDTVCQGV